MTDPIAENHEGTEAAAEAAARAKKSDTVRMVFRVAAGGVAIWWLVSGIVGLASR